MTLTRRYAIFSLSVSGQLVLGTPAHVEIVFDSRPSLLTAVRLLMIFFAAAPLGMNIMQVNTRALHLNDFVTATFGSMFPHGSDTLACICP